MSGGSGEQSASIEVTSIRIFDDDSGVARIVDPSNGEVVTGYVISPDLASFIVELESGDGGSGFDFSDLEPYNAEILPIALIEPNIEFRAGEFPIDGAEGETIVFVAFTTDGDASFSWVGSTEFDYGVFLTLGQQATDIPSLGLVNYSGFLLLGDMLAEDGLEPGIFTATADLDGTPDIYLDGFTESYGVSGTALISGGSFSSESMIITVGGLSVAANMEGDFHGDGANSIAGVIQTDSGIYRGGFVGSETLLPPL